MAKDIQPLSEHDRFVMCVPVFHGSHQVNDFDHGLTEVPLYFAVTSEDFALEYNSYYRTEIAKLPEYVLPSYAPLWKASSQIGCRKAKGLK